MKSSSKVDKLKIIEAYFTQPTIGDVINVLKPDMVDIYERISTWLSRWADELADQLAGVKKISASKEKALRRLASLLESALKKKFPESARALYTAVDGSSHDVQLNVNEGEDDMSKSSKAVKKSTKKSTGWSVEPTAATKKLLSKAAKKVVAPIVIPTAKKKTAGEIDHSSKIKLLIKDNPRRAGTHGHRVFESYHRAKTVKDVLDKGGKIADVRWDVDHKYISLSS